MDDYTAERPLLEVLGDDFYGLGNSLEENGIRYCIAGDTIIKTSGFPLVICGFYLVVADEQLKDAFTLCQGEFQVLRDYSIYRDERSPDFPLGWPGYVLSNQHAIEVYLVPSSFWHMDLSESSLSTNTFLHTKSQCRFPRKLFYLESLISIIHHNNSLTWHRNASILSYIILQYRYYVGCLSADFILGLPPADNFFVNFYGRRFPLTTKESICSNWGRIRGGLMTPKEAIDSISKKALLFEELTRKSYRTAASQAEAARAARGL